MVRVWRTDQWPILGVGRADLMYYDHWHPLWKTMFQICWALLQSVWERCCIWRRSCILSGQCIVVFIFWMGNGFRECDDRMYMVYHDHRYSIRKAVFQDCQACHSSFWRTYCLKINKWKGPYNVLSVCKDLLWDKSIHDYSFLIDLSSIYVEYLDHYSLYL